MKLVVLSILIIPLLIAEIESQTDSENTQKTISTSYRPNCGRTFFTGRRGFIYSHVHFEQRSLPRRLQCIWRIQMKPGERVLLFPIVMSLPKRCRRNSLEVFDGANTRARRLGRICGTNVEPIFISSKSRMTLRFRTDSSVSKKGFLLRYLSIPRISRSPGGYELQRSNRSCTRDEMKCRNSLCTPRSMVCDSFDDCGDQSDEPRCQRRNSCGTAYFQCNRGGKCLPKHKQCDGVDDCPNNEDEELCETDESRRSDDFDPADRNFACRRARNLMDDDEAQTTQMRNRRRRTPWMVSIRNLENHVCSGSILSRRWILTAASCLEYNGGREVVAGLYRLSDTGRRVQRQRISHVFSDPRRSKTNDNYDFAFIRLTRPLRWTRYVSPICLPTRRINPRAQCFTAGWEDTDRLQQGRVRIYGNRRCNRSYDGGITNKMLCARGRISCLSDFGAPMFCRERGKYVVHGVKSFGGKCDNFYSPSIYARVSSMLQWARSRTLQREITS